MFGTITAINLARNAWSKSQIIVQPDIAAPDCAITISNGTLILRQTALDKGGFEITPNDLKIGDKIDVAMSGDQAALIKVAPQQEVSLSERAAANLNLMALEHSRATGLSYGEAVKSVVRQNPDLARAIKRRG